METYEETQTNKMNRKIKENPFMPIGICGLIMACGYGAYMYRYRGKTSTSMYLLQLRVAAQGTIIGTLVVGVCYSLFNEYVLGNKKK